MKVFQNIPLTVMHLNRPSTLKTVNLNYRTCSEYPLSITLDTQQVSPDLVDGGSKGGTVIAMLIKILIIENHIFETIEQNEIQKLNPKVTMIRFQSTLNQIQKMYLIYDSLFITHNITD